MIYELRRYTLHPGQRDTLIELFEREFVESQEAAGIELAGQFRDLDAPDIFCWMRKFPDMEARRVALAAFYGGPAWKAHREAANATMIDSDDVLLLRPVAPHFADGEFPAHRQDSATPSDVAGDPSSANRPRMAGDSTPDSGPSMAGDSTLGSRPLMAGDSTPDSRPLMAGDSTLGSRPGMAGDSILGSRPGAAGDPLSAVTLPPVGAVALPQSVYLATVHHVVGDVAGFPAFFSERVAPVLARADASPVACFETEHSPNTFPALPVRTGEDVFVWLARFEREEDLGKVRDVLEEEVSLLEGRVAGPPQRFRLFPTARSTLR